jgi:phage recombination protein Bet
MGEQGIVKYEANGQEIELSPSIIKKYLVSGDADRVSDQEVQMFLKLCQYQKLNPFLREAYLIKYSNSPATMVTGKETFLKRAVHDPNYAGHETGMATDTKSAWAKVYKKNYKVPITVTVWYDEYVGRTKDGTITKMWREKPRTMLQKVALVQALREAFPDTFGGMYSQEEINHIDGDALDTKPVEPPQNETLDDIIPRTENIEDAEFEEIPQPEPQPEQKGLTDKEYTDRIGKMIMVLCNDDKDLAKDTLVGYTTFTGSDGNEVKGKDSLKKLAHGQLPPLYGKVKKIYLQFIEDNGIEDVVGIAEKGE